MVRLYKILSYVLLPIAVLMAPLVLMALPLALANPQLLIAVFLYASLVIYTFASYRFQTRIILLRQTCKSNLKDWIKVNAYVSVVLILMVLATCLMLYSNNKTINDALNQSFQLAQKMQGPSGNMTAKDFIVMLRKAMLFPLAIAVLYLVHIFLSFSLLKKYKDKFVE